MYPFLKDGVSVGTFTHEGSEITHYYVENAVGEEYEVSRPLWEALLKADGTRPLDLPNNGKSMLPKLKRCGIVQTSRFVLGTGLLNRFILFPISNGAQNGNKACKVINGCLPIMSAICFLLGMTLSLTHKPVAGGSITWWQFYCYAILSIALHEAGHLVSALAYGGYGLSDIGILLLGIIPIGGYVAYKEDPNSRVGKRIQFSLSGIEVNVLLAGICPIIATLFRPISQTMFCIANMNVVLACINLIPAAPLDGEAALSALLGVKSISKVAKKWVLTRKRRKRLLRCGFRGVICLSFFSLLLAFKALLRLLMGIEILFMICAIMWILL